MESREYFLRQMTSYFAFLQHVKKFHLVIFDLANFALQLQFTPKPSGQTLTVLVDVQQLKRILHICTVVELGNISRPRSDK